MTLELNQLNPNAHHDPRRFQGIARPYTPAEVKSLRGSVKVEHTLANLGAHRLWELLH